MTTRLGRTYKQHKEMSVESFEKVLQTLLDDHRKSEEEIAAGVLREKRKFKGKWI